MLSQTEKLVLYNLVKYPLANDRKLAEKGKLKLSTITACRRRLRARDYFSKVRIPFIKGPEILSVASANFISSLSLDERLDLGSKLDIEHPYVFWMISEPAQGMTLQLSKSYSEGKERIEKLEKIYVKQGYLGNSGISLIPFPLKLATIANFFDFTFLLNRLFRMNDKPLLPKFKFEDMKLSYSDKKVFHALIEYPELSDSDLAKKLRLSRPTVSRRRKKFEGKIMRTMTIPSLEKININILSLIYTKFNLSATQKDKQALIRDLLYQGSIFLVSEHVELVALVPFENFDAYRTYMNVFSKRHKEYALFVEEPKILLFSVPKAKFPKNHLYAPLVRSILSV